jgi:tetratricopeptide (TPR) repeat protein
VKRAAAYTYLTKFDKALEDLNECLTTYVDQFSESELNFIKVDIKTVENRRDSMTLKVEGDKRFEEIIYDAALGKYEEALALDPNNEYALGNIGLIHMKRNDHEKCIEATTVALNQIDAFLNDTKVFSTDNRMEVKLLLRRSNSYEKVGKVELAKKDLDSCVKLEPQNREA